ncbi:hypothetical protein [Labilibacter marinus]|uniref:hypothetical protein n=1 Tax=Labilibacter marinus TaxID=1477105 RepID=UPI00083517AE|nr:hypothetical protein [Labilibacter marinus]
MEKSKKGLGKNIGIILGVIIAVAVQQLVFKTPSFDKAMMKAASELNETCPVMVDKETRLDNAVTLPEKVFQYNYTIVNMHKDSVDLGVFEEYMQGVILNNVKTNPDLEEFRKNKVTMAYQYSDKHGSYITKIVIAAEDYLE